MRKIYITVLLVVSILTFSYSINKFYADRADIIIELSNIFNKVALPYHLLELSLMDPDKELLIPIRDLSKSAIDDTWGSARANNRTHEGVDIFAKRGTSVFSGTEGYVTRVGNSSLGGNFVFVTGKGGIRYYYAHLNNVALGIERGVKVSTDTVLGFVGNTGNASTTPPHLHFGMYKNGAKNPYELLVTR